MRPKLLGKLVEVRTGYFLKAGLVDIGDDLHPHPFELPCGLLLELEALGRLLAGDVAGGGEDPLLLIRVEALPQLVADPENRIVRFVLAHGEDRSDFVMPVDQIDIHGILREIHHPGLQGCIHAAERHVHRLRPIGRKHGVLGCGCLDANLEALEILDLANLLLPVHVTEALGTEADHVNALGGLVDHVPDRFEHLLVLQGLDDVIVRTKQEVQRHDAGLRRDGRRVRRGNNGKINVAGFDQLQDLRLLTQLRPGILLDEHRPLAQLLESCGKQIVCHAVAGRDLLIVSEAIMLDLLSMGTDGSDESSRGHDGDGNGLGLADGHCVCSHDFALAAGDLGPLRTDARFRKASTWA